MPHSALTDPHRPRHQAQSGPTRLTNRRHERDPVRRSTASQYKSVCKISNNRSLSTSRRLVLTRRMPHCRCGGPIRRARWSNPSALRACPKAPGKARDRPVSKTGQPPAQESRDRRQLPDPEPSGLTNVSWECAMPKSTQRSTHLADDNNRPIPAERKYSHA